MCVCKDDGAELQVDEGAGVSKSPGRVSSQMKIQMAIHHTKLDIPQVAEFV